MADVQIFLEGDIDFETLTPADTDDQIFRIAVLPADHIANKSIDINDLNAVMKTLEIDASSMEKFDMTK